MPFVTPGLDEIIERIYADIRSHVQGLEPTLAQSVEGGIGAAQGGAAKGLYDYLDYLSTQLFDSTATGIFLEARAAAKGLARKDAVAATGSILFTGTDTTVIPAGSALTRLDGEEFTTDEAVTITGGTATAQVTATEAGNDGNTATGSVLTLSTGISGVDPTAPVQSPGLAGGVDTEDDEDLRARLIQKNSNPPDGGSASDYEKWALEASPGVTRAFIQQNTPSLGNVTVLIVDDDKDPITPDAAVIDAVRAYIGEYTGPYTSSTERRPVTDFPIIDAPTLEPVGFVLSITPDTTEGRAAVEAELEDLFRTTEPGRVLYLSQMRQAIGRAAGIEDYDLTTPAADVTPATTSNLLTFGGVAWPS